MGLGQLGNRLYRGEVSVDFVGRSKRWYTLSAVILAIAIGSLLFRGLTLGIEFTGGAEFTVRSTSVSDATVPQMRGAVIGTGIEAASDPRVTIVGNDRIQVQTGSLTPAESDAVRDVVADTVETDPTEVTVQVVGPSWGKEITSKALLALGAFLIVVSIYLAIAFEWRMAVGALAALFHDIIATVGIYALSGFSVTPGTVIGFLTILGYSLYDTVVVFDKVRENTKGVLGQSQRTFAEAANLAVNQTLVRSINTSIIALLPIGSILVIGAGILGAGTLKDLSLALLIGVAVGTYSSIFIATPLFNDLKSKDPQVRALAHRVAARRGSGRGAAKPPVPASVATGDTQPASTGHREGYESGERRQPKRTTRSQRKSGQRGPRR